MSELSKYEQETIINFNLGDDTAIVYTRDRFVMKKLDMLVTEFPETYKCIKVTDIDKTYFMPKQCVNYRRPRRISAERREQVRWQMSELNCKRDS